MKKLMVFVVISIVLAMSVSLAGAYTLIAGKIYNADFSQTVENAIVEVSCGESMNVTTSLEDGTYAVKFNETFCDNEDITTVHAYCTSEMNCQDGNQNKIVGENTVNGTVHDFSALVPSLNLGVVNVPLIPEFSTIIAVLTILGAAGIFFLVRRN